MFVLVREGAIGSGTLPVREANRDVEFGGESPSKEASCEPPPGSPALERGVSGRMRPPSNGGATPDQGTPTTAHPVEALHAGGEYGALHEEKEEEKEMIYAASNEEEFDEPDVILAANPPMDL